MVTMKMNILRIFIPSQFNFDLRIYDFSYTWIEPNLDQLSVNAVHEWLELPNGTCTAEILAAPNETRRIRNSIYEDDGPEIETQSSIQAETQHRRWSEGYLACHVEQQQHSTRRSHHKAPNQVIGHGGTGIRSPECSDSTCSSTQTPSKIVHSHQRSIRRIDNLCMVHHVQQSSWRPLRIRQKGIPAAIAYGFEFVSMEKDGVGQMWTVWIGPDK